MKKNTLKTLGIMVLTATMLASTVTGCGDKETSEGQATEVVEAAAETEAVVPETEVVEEAAEEIVMEDTETTEATETEVAQEELAFHVTDMSATKYAKQKVNVRSGASTDYEQIGSLGANQKVTVTGQADTGWYRIDYNGKVGYVSDKYLSDQKVTTSASSANTNTANNTSTTAPSADTSGNSTNTGTTNTNTGNNTPSTDTGNTNTPSMPSTDTGSTNAPSTPSTDTGNTGDASTGGATTPSTPETSTPSLPDGWVDGGSIGGAGTWEGPIDEGPGNNEIVWEQ